MNATNSTRHAIALLFTATLLAGLCAGTARAAIYHVSPTGDDTAAGDADHPFQTLSQAANVARSGDVVMVAPGVYRESLELARSGEPLRPIIFQAEKPGTAIITGADPLTIWTGVGGHPGQYVTDWGHDFIIDQNPDGSPVRAHGAPAPIGCAEQILWEEHPLSQVMDADKLQPGCFYVDWEFHTLTVWLPGDADPRSTDVEGCVRSFLVTPAEKYNVFADTRYITLRGLVFRDAANFAQRGGAILGNNWRMEDCIVENDNAGGISLNGNNIVVLRTTAQYNGFTGIGGSGNDNTLDGCIVRGNNRKEFPPDWEGGGGKFVGTDHLKIIRHESYDNIGPGLWLDTDNTNYSITDSSFHGNRGLDAGWEGAGVFLEINHGPGEVSGNNIYSNTGAGILLAESDHIAVTGNVLVDNERGIELRAMADRGNYHLQDITITGNRFKQWRGAAVATSLGDWTPQSAAQRAIRIDENIYDPSHDLPIMTWGDAKLMSIEQVQSQLHLEMSGGIGAVAFSRKLENSKIVRDESRLTIRRALSNAAVGQIVSLPANYRSAVETDGSCAIFDLDHSSVSLEAKTPGLQQRLRDAVPDYPVATPVMVEARIEQMQGGEVRAQLVEIK